MSPIVEDALRNMDPAIRVALAIFLAVVLRSAIAEQWRRFKVRETAKPTPMRKVKGIFVPWGTVERIERLGKILLVFWAIWIVGMLLALAWIKLIRPIL